MGKLTVATRLAELTGFRLFHNHLTVNAMLPVFDFGTAPFMEVIHRLRLDVFETAARHGVSMIFTNNNAWNLTDGRTRFRQFVNRSAAVVERAGGSARFVCLQAPLEVLVGRLDDESRRPHGKLADPDRLRQLVTTIDVSPIHDDHLVLDTSTMSADEAAERIAASL